MDLKLVVLKNYVRDNWWWLRDKQIYKMDKDEYIWLSVSCHSIFDTTVIHIIFNISFIFFRCITDFFIFVTYFRTCYNKKWGPVLSGPFLFCMLLTFGFLFWFWFVRDITAEHSSSICFPLRAIYTPLPGWVSFKSNSLYLHKRIHFEQSNFWG